jgi:hypothetical protein
MTRKYIKPENDMQEKVLSKGTSAINGSGISWDPDKGITKINPPGFSDSDELGVTIDGSETITLNSTRTKINSQLDNVSIDNQSINPIAGIAPSSVMTPTQIFISNKVKYMTILMFLKEIKDLLDDIDSEDYGSSVKYVYEVIDYDDFSPS